LKSPSTGDLSDEDFNQTSNAHKSNITTASAMNANEIIYEFDANDKNLSPNQQL
jgi:hypothetical protein